MSTETGHQSRGGLRRHTKAHLGSGPKGNHPSPPAKTSVFPEARPDIASHCRCGCGTEINHKAFEVLRLRNLGWPLRKIAEEWGEPEGRVRMYTRQPPRYVLGHSTPKGKWLDGQCHRCGAQVKVAPNQTKPPKCRNFNCDGLDVLKALERNCREYDERGEAKRSAVRERSAIYTARIRLLGGPITLDGTRRRIPRRKPDVVAADNRRLHNLELEAAVNGATPELLALIAEQRADNHDRGVLASYMKSLDEPLPGSWGTVRTLYDKLDAAHNRHTLAWARPTEDSALDHVTEWEEVLSA